MLVRHARVGVARPRNLDFLRRQGDPLRDRLTELTAEEIADKIKARTIEKLDGPDGCACFTAAEIAGFGYNDRMYLLLCISDAIHSARQEMLAAFPNDEAFNRIHRALGKGKAKEIVDEIYRTRVPKRPKGFRPHENQWILDRIAAWKAANAP